MKTTKTREGNVRLFIPFVMRKTAQRITSALHFSRGVHPELAEGPLRPDGNLGLPTPGDSTAPRRRFAKPKNVRRNGSSS